MFSIYIFDDNAMYSKSIKNIIQKHPQFSSEFSLEYIQIINDSFEEFADSLANNLSKNNVYIIDIDLMVSINGLQLAKRIRSFDINGYIIFLTAHIEMTAITYHYNLKALNFIYKGDPNLQQLLFDSLDQIVSETCKKPLPDIPTDNFDGYYSYSYKSHFYKINYSDILFIETHGLKRCLLLHTNEKSYECQNTINNLLATFPPSFIQCHRSYVVNSRRVKEVTLQNDQYVTVKQ